MFLGKVPVSRSTAPSLKTFLGSMGTGLDGFPSGKAEQLKLSALAQTNIRALGVNKIKISPDLSPRVILEILEAEGLPDVKIDGNTAIIANHALNGFFAKKEVRVVHGETIILRRVKVPYSTITRLEEFIETYGIRELSIHANQGEVRQAVNSREEELVPVGRILYIISGDPKEAIPSPPDLLNSSQYTINNLLAFRQAVAARGEDISTYQAVLEKYLHKKANDIAREINDVHQMVLSNTERGLPIEKQFEMLHENLGNILCLIEDENIALAVINQLLELTNDNATELAIDLIEELVSEHPLNKRYREAWEAHASHPSDKRNVWESYAVAQRFSLPAPKEVSAPKKAKMKNGGKGKKGKKAKVLVSGEEKELRRIEKMVTELVRDTVRLKEEEKTALIQTYKMTLAGKSTELFGNSFIFVGVPFIAERILSPRTSLFELTQIYEMTTRRQGSLDATTSEYAALEKLKLLALQRLFFRLRKEKLAKEVISIVDGPDGNKMRMRDDNSPDAKTRRFLSRLAEEENYVPILTDEANGNINEDKWENTEIWGNFRSIGFRKHYDEGIRLLQAGVTMAGIAEVETALECCPDSPSARQNLSVAYNQLGSKLLSTGDANSALEYLLKALDYYPENVDVMKNLALIYASVGDHKIAEGLYRKIIAVMDSEGFEDRGSTQTGELDGARAVARRGLGIALANRYSEVEDEAMLEEAIVYLEEAFKSLDSDWSLNYFLFVSQLTIGNFKRAITVLRHLTRALNNHKEDPGFSVIILGNILSFLVETYEEKLTNPDFKNGIGEVAPDIVRRIFNELKSEVVLADVFSDDEATLKTLLPLCHSASRLARIGYPEVADEITGYFISSEMRTRLGETVYHRLLYQRGVTLYQMGRYEESIECAQVVADFDGAKSFVLAAEFGEGDLSLEDNAYNLLFAVYIKQHDETKNPRLITGALDLFERRKATLTNNPIVLNTIGNCYEKVGLMQQAEASYQKALELYPDFLLPHLNIAKHLFERKRALPLHSPERGPIAQREKEYVARTVTLFKNILERDRTEVVDLITAFVTGDLADLYLETNNKALFEIIRLCSEHKALSMMVGNVLSKKLAKRKTKQETVPEELAALVA